jgi:hypothetical protein
LAESVEDIDPPEVIMGSMNYAVECLRRGDKWLKFNHFTRRMEYRYVTLTDREIERTEKGDRQETK